MAYAVTHILLPLIIVDFYRHYIAKKKFSKNLSLVAGIAGLFPDIDIPISYLWSKLSGELVWIHRNYTHSIIFVVAFLLIAFIIKKNKKQLYFRKFSRRQTYLFFVMLAIGWSFHILLDCALAADYTLTWIPYLADITFCPVRYSQDLLLSIDAILLVLWLTHEKLKNKIKDFI